MEINAVLVRNVADWINLWKKYESQTPFSVTFQEIRCKYCSSKDIVRYGHSKNRQCWWCKDCRRKFINSKPLAGMKVSFEAIRTALRMFFKGIPLQTIRRQLEDDYNFSPTRATIVKWVERVTLEILEADKNVHPKVGDTWIILETPLTVGKKNYWILDVLDTQTLFLLATRLSRKREENDIRLLLEASIGKVGKRPTQIITSRRAEYFEVLELLFGADIKQLQINDSQRHTGVRIPADWSRPFVERTAVLQGHREEGSIHIILEGWRVQYDFYRNHEVLNGKTPGQEAGVSFKYSHGRFESLI